SSKQRVENSNLEEHLPPVVTMADTHRRVCRRAARRWLEKEPPHSITTWEDLLSKFINEFFPLSRTTNLRNEISNFQQRFDESFHEACDRYKDLLRACPHHGGNLLERSTQDVLTIIENKYKQTSAVTTAMTAMLKQFQAGAHPYYQCLAAGGNTFPELRDNIQGYVSVAAINYNQDVQNNQNQFGPSQGFKCGNKFNHEQSYQATSQQNHNFHLNELEKIKRMNEANMKAMQTQIDMVKNELRIEMKSSIQTYLSNQTNEIKNMMASLLQMNTASTSGSGSLPSNTVANPKGELKYITTRSGLVTDGPTVPTPPKSITREVDERVEETYTNPDLAEYTIKMILRDGDERLTLNIRHDTSSYSNLPQKESINLINIFNVLSEEFLEVRFSNQPSGNPTFSPHQELTSPEVTNDIFDSEGCNVLSEKLRDLHSIKDLHPYFHDNLLSGSITYSSNLFLEEFTDELALITYPSDYDDNIHFDIESDLKEIEILLYQDKDSNLQDSIDQKDPTNLAAIFVDPIPEMFTDEHAPDYSSPLIFDVYDDDFLEVDSYAENVYDDPFDSKEEKIKDSKLLIDELDLPCDFLPHSKYDSFNSQDFSRVDALPSTNNEDKVFNPGILIHEKPIEIITRVVHDKKLAISNASLVFEDFDHPFYEPLFFKEVPKAKMLLPFSSENEEKVFKPGIHTFEKVHSYFIPELSHQGYKMFIIDQIFKSLMKIFLFHYGKNTPILDVPLFHFYPP
nr:hypothetical protein [Tanacetum cinerariifolium]